MNIKTITKNTNTEPEINLDELFNNIKNVIMDISPYMDSEIDRQIQNLKDIKSGIQNNKQFYLIDKKKQIKEIENDLELIELKNVLLKTINHIATNDTISLSTESKKQLNDLLENMETYNKEMLISKNDLLKNTIRRLGL